MGPRVPSYKMLSKEGHSRAPARSASHTPQIVPAAWGRPARFECHGWRAGELDVGPTRLRENLEELAALLRGASPRVRRRILQVFGELVALWQERRRDDALDADLTGEPVKNKTCALKSIPVLSTGPGRQTGSLHRARCSRQYGV